MRKTAHWFAPQFQLAEDVERAGAAVRAQGADTHLDHCGDDIAAGLGRLPTGPAGVADGEDEAALRDFATRIRRKIDDGDLGEPEIPGNRPYRKAASAGIVPKATHACIKCGVCAAKCPVGAIDPQDPKRVDKQRCISCMRCVAVCPHGARRINRLMLALAGRMLKRACSVRKGYELYL